MKDQMFFIFTILYLTCSAWITDHKAPFCSVDKGTQLLYQIDSEQAERYYFQQTTEKIDFSGLGDYGGILLSPGPGIPAEAGELLKLIEFCKYTHPILGICLGHQAIAETFGASLYNLSRPLHGHRSVLKKVDEHDPLFEDLADPIQVGRYHSWVIDPETMPGELITSSIDEQGHIMSFYHTELPIHGIQFHPESYISDCGSGIIRNWLKMVR